MIHITIKYDEWFDIQIEGHAGYAPKGKDIVCAAVSALYQTLVATFEHPRLDFGTLEHIRSNDGFEQIHIHDDVSCQGSGVIEAFRVGCKALADAYPKYVHYECHIKGDGC